MSDHKQEHGYLVSHAGGFFAGVIMGGLIGSGAMMLLAPRSGKKTRAKLQREGLELRDQVTETIEDAVAQARGKAHRVVASIQKQAVELRECGQDMLDEQMQVASQVVEAEKTALHNVASG